MDALAPARLARPAARLARPAAPVARPAAPIAPAAPAARPAAPVAGPAASRIAWAGAGLAAAAAWLALRAGFVPPSPACALREIASIGCPTCGFTRALEALARGDLHDSIAFHPMAIAIVAQALAAWLAWGWSAARGRTGIPGPWIARAIALDVAIGLGVWIVRLATATIPA